jgi:hypothetical protein
MNKTCTGFNTTTMITGPHFPRTEADVIARAKDNTNPFKFSFDVLADYLPAEVWIREGVVKPDTDPATFNTPITQHQGYGPKCDKPRPVALTDAEWMTEAARHYAAFGWTKVHHHRGLSASRTIDKMREWLWLLGFDPESVTDVDARWGQYGAGCLADICRHLGFPVPDEEWARRMESGEPCEPGCTSGCGL